MDDLVDFSEGDYDRLKLNALLQIAERLKLVSETLVLIEKDLRR